MKKQTENSATLLRYCVGIDVSKDSLQICLSTIDTSGKTAVKGTTKVTNKTPFFDGLLTWVAKHCKEKHLPVRYLMESTGVYHEQIAWHLFQNDLLVSIAVTDKSKNYLKSLGHKYQNDKIDARGLAQMGLEQTPTL